MVSTRAVESSGYSRGMRTCGVPAKLRANCSRLRASRAKSSSRRTTRRNSATVACGRYGCSSGNLLGQLREAGEDVEIDFHAAADAGVLHFHHHVFARRQPRAVRLADRRRGERRRVEIGEQSLERLAELRFDRLADDLRIVAGHAGLQLLQFLRRAACRPGRAAC